MVSDAIVDPVDAAGRGRYHHGDLPAAMIAAGLELTRTGGPAALSLREIARRVGVSPNAAYRHFASRDAILVAVSGAIETAMAQRMADGDGVAAIGALGAAARGVDLLYAVGMGYIEFAIDEPGWYAVAFFASLDDARASVESSPAYLALTYALDRMVVDGDLAADRRDGAQWPCWSAVHGFAEMALRGPLRTYDRADVMELGRRTVHAVIEGIRE